MSGSRFVRMVRVGTSILAIVLIITTITVHMRTRAVLMDRRASIATTLDGTIRSLAGDAPEGRVAIWHSGGNSAGIVRPEATFHFWGNHRYSNDRFDEELLRAFPGETFFNYNVIRTNPAGDIITGEQNGVRPQLFIFPENKVKVSEFEGESPDMLSALSERLETPLSLSHTAPLGEPWIILRACPSPEEAESSHRQSTHSPDR